MVHNSARSRAKPLRMDNTGYEGVKNVRKQQRVPSSASIILHFDYVRLECWILYAIITVLSCELVGHYMVNAARV